MMNKKNKSLPKALRKGQAGINNQGLQMTIIEYRNSKDIDVQFEDEIIIRNKRYAHFLEGNIVYPNYYNKNRIGEIRINNQGLQMTIIEYRRSDDIDVQFEDETIVKHKAYSCFLRGTIAYPYEKRIGEININNQGLQMTIIEYRNSKDIDVQFEDGTIVENKSYYAFKNGEIANPNECNSKIINNKNRIGEININNQGLQMTIIDYRNCDDIDVQFEDETIVKHKQYGSFLIGNIANPNECSDGISIPNKMLRQISFQLGLNLQFEYSPIWLEKKRLDGYDDDLKIAIEMDGNFGNHEDKTVDNWKDEQCLKNGIYIIRIDLTNDEYNKNKFEYIKKQILNSPLSLIYNLSNINWELAWENSLKSLVWEVKRLVEEGYMNVEITEMLDISENTVKNYKKQLDIKTRNEIKQENMERTKELLEQGKTNREIAEMLNVHRCTVTNYKKELNKQEHFSSYLHIISYKNI